MNRIENKILNPFEEFISDESFSNSNYDLDKSTLERLIIEKFENNKGLKYIKIYPTMFNKLNENIYYINTIANILEELIISNIGKVNIINIFNSNKIPNINLKNYLHRFYKFSKASFESFILSLIYIDRLCDKRIDFFVNEWNCHKLVFTAFSLATKFQDDLRLNNKDFCKIGGVKAIDLNKLETEFLNLIEYDVNIKNDTYFNYICEIFLNEK